MMVSCGVLRPMSEGTLQGEEAGLKEARLGDEVGALRTEIDPQLPWEGKRERENMPAEHQSAS